MIHAIQVSKLTPVVPLGQVADFLDHQRKPVKESERQDGEYPYYGANGQQGTISDFLFDEPLVLLAEDGGYFDEPDRGVAYKVSGKTWVNNHAHVLRPTAKVDIGFLTRHLERYDLLPFVNGTTRSKLTKANAERIPIWLPPLPEQRRIGAILDKADAIRRKREEGIRLTEELLRSTFLEMFGDPANASAKPLAELAEVVSGVTKGRKLNGRAVTVPYLRVANVQDGFLNLDEIKTIEALPNEVEALALKPGDIVMTEGGDHDKLGRGAIWTGTVRNCIHQNHVFRVRVNRQHILPDFFAAYLRTNEAKRYFLRCAKKTTNLASINMTQLRGLPVPVPPVRLQQKFQDAAKAINEMSQARKQAVAESQSMFGSLVQRAFRGEL